MPASSQSRPEPDRLLSRLAVVALVTFVVATGLHIAYVTALEPFSFDAWNVADDTDAKPFSLRGLLDYWQHQYGHSNPRIGQVFTYLAYKLEWFAVIATPLAYLGLTLAITVLGLGRWPSRARDLALWAIAIGCGWFAFPEIGRNMFCRAYGANYVYGAAIQLWFVTWLRVGFVKAAPSTLQCVEYALFGVIAGMCNEHTGPALVALLGGYAWWSRRRGRPVRHVIAGGTGALIGFAAIFFAPGQGERYDGLAQRASLFDRVVDRGADGNLELFRDYLLYAAPVLALVVVALVCIPRDRSPGAALWVVALGLAAGVVVTATLFASPKLGSRFYLAPIAVLLAGFVAVLDLAATSWRRLVPVLALAALASIYAAHRTVPLFRTVARQGEARMAALVASTPGTVFVADPWTQVGESWWFIGDDFRSASKLDLVARYFGLSRVVMRAYDPGAPLGTLGARVVPRVWIDGRVDEGRAKAFDATAYAGTDVEDMHRATASAIERLRARVAPRAVERVELVVEVAGAPPPLPRRTVLLSRWTPERADAHTATLRRGRDGRITVELPPELVQSTLAIHVARVGRDVRNLPRAGGRPLRFAPWRGGASWVLACDATTCFVIATSR